MRQPAPDARPIALTIAGSDSGGGAGIQADLATMAAHGVYGTAAITAVTAQHTRGVTSSHVLPRDEVAAQIDAVADDFAVGAAKTGMLATTEIVELVAERAAGFPFPLVVDPVMVATSGDRLLDAAAERAYEDLLAEAALVTPNADETAVLTGVEVDGEATAREAGEELLAMGADAALVKGGHVPGETVRDVLVTENGAVQFDHDRVDTDASHGSGCALSAAIAARLAAGDGIHAAVDAGTDFVARAIRYHYDVGRGPGAVNHCVGIRDRAAREPTIEAVRSVVERLADADVGPLVPEVGTNVAGATPFAEGVDDVAAVDGRVRRTSSGIEPTGDVRFGASTYVAGVVLGARERHGSVRFGLNCRFDDDVAAALDERGWPTVEIDPDDVPAGDGVAGPRDAVVRALDRSDGAPVAVVDRARVATEPGVTLLAATPGALADRTLDLLAALPRE